MKKDVIMRMSMEQVQQRQQEIMVELRTADDKGLDDLNEESGYLVQRKKQLEIEEIHARSNKNVVGGDGGVNLLQREEPQATQNRSYSVGDEIYKRAWAKSLMLQPLTQEETQAVNVVNQRALGTAVTTTATQYVEATALTDGVNNGGLLIPTSVMSDLLATNTLQSPILRDVMKLNVRGRISFPYKKSSSKAEWVEENTPNTDGKAEWAEFTLTGKSLSKTVRVTWQLEGMAPESFITYLVSELQSEMAEALAIATIYGTGNNEMNGISNTSIQHNYAEGANLVEHLTRAFLKIPKKKRLGAKAYVSDEMYTELTLQKDDAGNYVYRQDTSGTIKVGGKYEVEADPYLMADDYVVGNLGRYYKLNENEKMSITKDVSGKARINDYTAFGIFDGNFEPGTLVFGTKE